MSLEGRSAEEVVALLDLVLPNLLCVCGVLEVIPELLEVILLVRSNTVLKARPY